MSLKNFTVKETGAIFQVETADNFLGRFLGLMGRKKLESGRGLLLTPCNSIHMCFMRFSIDAIYIDKNFTIKKIVNNLRPWIGLSMCSGAFGVLEVPAGDAEKFNLQVGQTLEAEDKF